MNVQEKQKQQQVIIGILQGIDFQLQQAVKRKLQFSAATKDLIEHGTATYSQEMVSKQIANTKVAYQTDISAIGAKIIASLESLRKLIAERDAVLDLTNPSLANALRLINESRGNLPFETMVQINNNFLHDQSALRALQAAYKSQNLASNVDSLIYSADSTIDALEETVKDQFSLDGSVNYFSSQFAKFSALEGLKIDASLDQAGLLDAMLKGTRMDETQATEETRGTRGIANTMAKAAGV